MDVVLGDMKPMHEIVGESNTGGEGPGCLMAVAAFAAGASALLVMLLVALWVLV